MGTEKKKRRRESEKAGGEKSSKKVKNEASEVVNGEVPAVEAVAVYVSPIALPMATRKLQKRLFKLVGKAAKVKSVRRGIKEVVLALRKGEKGVCAIAGDVYPVDVIAHIPLLCEEADVPYCYVSRKADLGAAGLTKRPTSVALISMKQADEELQSDIKKMGENVTAIFPETF